MQCPDCKTILLSGSTKCPCGWKAKQQTERREPVKACPVCQAIIPAYYHYHRCGWMNAKERLVTDAIAAGPKKALERYWAVGNDKEKLKEYEATAIRIVSDDDAL